MRVGIDISQIVYEGTGVSKYVKEMVRSMLDRDPTNEYVLFGASWRKQGVFREFYRSLAGHPNVFLKIFPLPPTLLDLLWNTLHILPVELFVGSVDVFWSSDWTQPPLARATGMTTIHDLIALKFPDESHGVTEFHSDGLRISSNIVATHRRRLTRVSQECDIILCDSLATKKDCMRMLSIPESKLHVVYPGFSV